MVSIEKEMIYFKSRDWAISDGFNFGNLSRNLTSAIYELFVVCMQFNNLDIPL